MAEAGEGAGMRSRLRRLALNALALLALALATLSVSAALRDVDPPRLYYEAPGRVPEGASVELFVSADEPVTYVVDYAGEELREVAQDHVFVLTAAPGVNEVSVSATDAAGNETVVRLSVEGVEPVDVKVTAAGELRAGDPLGVTVAIDEHGARVTDVFAAFAGVALPLWPDGAVLRAVAATPFGVEPAESELEVSVTDEFGRVVTATVPVTLEPLAVTVEQLRIAPSVLAAVTPEAQAMERELMEAGVAAGAPRPLWSEPFLMPITGRETSGFADARRYVAGGRVSYHNGLDIAAPQGTPVAVANDGVVVVAGQYPVKGGWVMVDHGFGVFSHYFHMSRIDVQVGQEVSRGEVIGAVGSTGLATGPHLHWEVRVGLAPTNPLEWVDRAWP